MNPYFYDLALVEKIKEVYAGEVTLAPVDSLFEETATERQGKIKFPLIGVHRQSWKLSAQDMSTAEIFGIGAFPTTKDDNGDNWKFNRIAINLNYQIDVLSDTQRVTDGLSAELTWFFTVRPNLKFKVAKPFDWVCEDSQIFVQDVTDNTDISSFHDRNRIYRTTFDLIVSPAWLWHITPQHITEDIPINVDLLE
jgi:hypothetical protein